MSAPAPTPMDFQVLFAHDRDMGQRANQEDYGQFLQLSAFSNSGGDLVYALADGMGGLAGGEIASKLVVSAFLRALKNEGPDSARDVQASLLRSMQAADAALGRRKRLEEEKLKSMGCTLCCVRMVGSKLYFLSVGDSLLYLVRGGMLWRLNDLHNYREDMRRLAEQEGADWNIVSQSNDIRKNGSRLTSYMFGSESGVQQVHCPATPVDLEAGDYVLVASDGLLTLTPREIVGILQQNRYYGSAERDVSELLDLVLYKKNPHQDNVSVGLIRLASASLSTKSI